MSRINDAAFNLSFGFDITYDCESGNFYGFVSSRTNSTFTQIDYGSSLSNNGTIINTIPSPATDPAGLDLVKDGTNWYIAAVATSIKQLMV